jgi:hypothetical protein
MAMTFYQELDDLRARVAALEAKYETMRLATTALTTTQLECGKDVENLQRWSDQHLLRIERLETGATCPHIVSSDEGTSYCDLALQTQDKLDRLIAQDRDDITPPPELVQQWVAEIWHEGTPVRVSLSDEHIATRAAQWGADQELKACCEVLAQLVRGDRLVEHIRAARRPTSSNLKQQALEALRDATGSDYPHPMTVLNAEQHSLIRCALEALPDD